MGISAAQKSLKNQLIMIGENNFCPSKARHLLNAAMINNGIKSTTKILDIAKDSGAIMLTELLVSPSEFIETALHEAVKVENDVIVQKLLCSARDIEDNKKTLIKLLTFCNREDETALHYAAKKKFINDDIPTKILDFAKQAGVNTLIELLLFPDRLGNTALHKAIEVGNNFIVQRLLHAADSIADNQSTLTTLLLSPDNSKETALHKAVTVRNDIIVHRLLSAADSVADNQSTLTTLLLSLDKYGKTVLHYSAFTGNIGILKMLLLSADSVKENNTVLTTLLLSLDNHGDTAVYNAIIAGNTNIAKTLLLTARYIGKNVLAELVLSSSKQGNDMTLPNVLDINNFILRLGDYTDNQYIETHTLKELFSVEEFGLSGTKNYTSPIRSKRSAQEELGNVIDQDSNDNAASKNVDTKSGGWFQWVNDLLQLPSIFKGAEATVIENKIVHSEEEYEYFNQTNHIPSSSNTDIHLESVGYNTNYTASNSSSRPLIGNDVNNSVQNIVLSIADNVVLLRVLLKILGINISLGNNGNNYTSPQEEHEMKLEALALEVLTALHMRNSLRDEDLFEDGALDLLCTNNSSSELQGDIQENEPE